MPTEEIAQTLHELVDFILADGLQGGETAVLWYEPDTDELLTWVGSKVKRRAGGSLTSSGG